MSDAPREPSEVWAPWPYATWQRRALLAAWLIATGAGLAMLVDWLATP